MSHMHRVAKGIDLPPVSTILIRAHVVRCATSQCLLTPLAGHQRNSYPTSQPLLLHCVRGRVDLPREVYHALRQPDLPQLFILFFA